MKKRFVAVLLSVFMMASSLTSQTQAATLTEADLVEKKQPKETFAEKTEPDYVKNELIVVYEDEALSKKELKADGVNDQRILAEESKDGGAVAVVTVDEDTSLKEAMKDIQKEDGVDYVQKNYTYSIQDIQINDPQESKQHYLNQSDIRRAWSEKSANTANVTVAVLDTGINYLPSKRHEDLQDVSDGGNVLYEYGYNAETDTLFSESGWYEDDVYWDYVGHGTEVASVISAQTNNGMGMAGVSFNARILPINVFEIPKKDMDKNHIIKIKDVNYRPYLSHASTESMIAAYNYVIAKADELNIKVVNMSLAGRAANDKALQAAINKAYSMGIITVAAAGNEGKTEKLYPASLNNVISVAAITSKETWATFSQHNSAVDLCAPGDDILTAQAGVISYYDSSAGIWKEKCYNNKQYATNSGTSYSAPIVSAVAAMLYGVNPDFSASKVQTLLKDTAMDLGVQGKDTYFGAGEVNGYYALKKARGKSYSKDHKMESVNLSDATIRLSKSDHVYNGKEVKPTVLINYEDIKLLSGTQSNGNVTLTYPKSMKNVGSYKITMKGIGNVKGTINKTVTINPVETQIVSLTSKSKQFTVKWKKKETQVSGYQVRYSTSESMKKAKTKSVSGYKKVSKTIKKLKKKKNYYVQVRTYKTVNKKKYYSAWTDIKKIKTK